jgi:hypothetical protein
VGEEEGNLPYHPTSLEGPSIAELHAKIGKLAMENHSSSGALGRTGGTSAKR